MHFIAGDDLNVQGCYAGIKAGDDDNKKRGSKTFRPELHEFTRIRRDEFHKSLTWLANGRVKPSAGIYG